MKHQIKDNYIIAKPFVKWAGGKGSLISQLIENLPQDFAEQPNVTYIEPFVGGGANRYCLACRNHNFKTELRFEYRGNHW